MAVEEARIRARRELEEVGLSMESASYLVDERPSGGWDSLVTRDQLRAEMAELRTELQRELRAQTWRIAGLVLVAFGVFATLVRVV